MGKLVASTSTQESAERSIIFIRTLERQHTSFSIAVSVI
jgi:hypothetical protein